MYTCLLSRCLNRAQFIRFLSNASDGLRETNIPDSLEQFDFLMAHMFFVVAVFAALFLQCLPASKPNKKKRSAQSTRVITSRQNYCTFCPWTVYECLHRGCTLQTNSRQLRNRSWAWEQIQTQEQTTQMHRNNT